MRLDGNTVLITGGATGIGLALAKAFIHGGSEFIVCARTEEHLKEAKKILPSLHTRKTNVADETERQALYEWAVATFLDLNVLVNNAGIQRMVDFRKGTDDLFKYRAEDGEDEIEINLRALVYITALFTPHLLMQKRIYNYQCLIGPCLYAFGPTSCLMCDESRCSFIQYYTPAAARRNSGQDL